MGKALLLDFLYKPRMLLNSRIGRSPLFIILIYVGSPSFLLLTLSELPQTCSITDSLHFHPKSLVNWTEEVKTVKLLLKGRNCLPNQNFLAVKAKSTGMQGFAFGKKGEVFSPLLNI